eukprot:1375218-Alexandrium_andersonii.AAC.1
MRQWIKPEARAKREQWQAEQAKQRTSLLANRTGGGALVWTCFASRSQGKRRERQAETSSRR